MKMDRKHANFISRIKNEQEEIIYRRIIDDCSFTGLMSLSLTLINLYGLRRG